MAAASAPSPVEVSVFWDYENMPLGKRFTEGTLARLRDHLRAYGRLIEWRQLGAPTKIRRQRDSGENCNPKLYDYFGLRGVMQQMIESRVLFTLCLGRKPSIKCNMCIKCRCGPRLS